MRTKEEVQAKIDELLLDLAEEDDETEMMHIEAMLIALRWTLGSSWPVPPRSGGSN